MKRTLVIAGAVMLGAPAVHAQEPLCPPGSSTISRERATQDACQKAVDLYKYMAPQMGTAIAGGNATLGQGSTLGGPGHFVVSVRANAVAGSVPRVEDQTPGITGAQQSTYELQDQPIMMPAVDAAVGVFKGLGIGFGPFNLTNVGGLDLLVSASYLPEFEKEGVTVETPDGGIEIGYGARLGVLEESLVVPGLSVTYLKRDLPTTNIIARTTNGDLDVRELSLKTSSWRVVASKSLMHIFSLAAGIGQDRYESSADIQARVNTSTSDVIPLRQNLTRTNYFLDGTMNIFLLKLTGEIGMVQGGTIETFNQFDGKAADASRLYGSIGFRLGF